MTSAQVSEIAKVRGKSGRLYRFVGGGAECAECGTPFGATFPIEDGEPLPVLHFDHNSDGSHTFSMTGDSEAARALRDGKVIASASAGGSADGSVN